MIQTKLLFFLRIGVPAALFVEHKVDQNSRNSRFGAQPSRPGCFVPADPFKVSNKEVLRLANSKFFIQGYVKLGDHSNIT